MSHGGRPRALDDGKRREICALISVGCGIEAAAEYVGCSPSTIRREALRNDDFRQQYRNAEIASHVNPLRALQKATSTHWRAAAWLLERTDPKRYGRRSPDHFTPEEWQDLYEQFAAGVSKQLAEHPDCQRIISKVEAIGLQAMREVYAQRNVDREERRARRKSRRNAPGKLPPSVVQNPPAHFKTQKRIA